MTRDEIKAHLEQYFPGFYLVTSGDDQLEIAMPWTTASTMHLTIYIGSLELQTLDSLDSYMQKAAQLCTKKTL